MKVTLPIKLTDKQKVVDASAARFKVVKAGRRSGKTKYGSYWLAKRALTVVGKHWYVCNSMELIRDEMWPNLCQLLEGFIAHKDDRLFRIKLINGSMIVCKSATMENALRGRGLSSLFLDEASFVRPRLWDMIIRPMLADKKAPALIASSAKKGWFTNIFKYASTSGDKDWESFHFTIYDNPHIEKSEIETIKKSTPLDTWKQEYMGEDVSHSGQVYSEWKDQIYEPTSKPAVNSWPTVIGMDWGLAAATAAVWCHVSPEGKIIVSREHVRSGWDVSRHSGVLKQISASLTNPLIEYVLDGSAFKREGTSGVSIGEQFQKFGVYCRRAERDFEGGVNLVKQFLNAGWVEISSDCTMLLSAIREWEHDEHEPDVVVAFRYAVTHIVKRGMTKLSTQFPGQVQKFDKAPEEAVKEMMAKSNYRLPLNNTKKSWTVPDWDYENGCPIGTRFGFA